MSAPAPRHRLARAALAEVPLYDPRRAPVALDLTDNTNRWGVPPRAAAVLRALDGEAVTRYPTLYTAELKAALADRLGVTADMVVTGCGSDDLLDCAFRAVAEPDMVVAAPVPSFAMVPLFARGNALRYVGVVEDAAHQPDLDALLAARPRILYLCSPNNPTGVPVARTRLERAVAEAPGLVVVDEAYAEYAGATVIDLLAHADNLLVVRTCSKAYGLAGLRVGYAVGAPALVHEVEKARGPYKVSAPAERAALAAVRDDAAWVDHHVALAVALRERLADALRARGLAPLPSGANFVCVPVPHAVAVGQALRARGVAVRPFEGLPHVGDALRISVGPWEQLQAFLDAFDAVRAGTLGTAA